MPTEKNEVIQRENTRGAIVGKSLAAQSICAQIVKAARAPFPVLILGETGTGKELVARDIHARSERRDAPFVPVNMGAMPRELIVSELFGHTKGAFTGASQAKEGYFQHADGGTLFLDEITTMDEATQVALLRVLDAGKYQPVGADSESETSARIVSATNVGLQDAVESGAFREDLMHRLQVLCIEVPPLRERAEDIPLLAEHFLATFSEEFDYAVSTISGKAMALMQSYTWPGNVRELRNVIAHAAVTADRGEIRPEHLPERVRTSNIRKYEAKEINHLPRNRGLSYSADNFMRRNGGAQATSNSFAAAMGLTLDDVTKAYVLQTLEYCGNNKSSASKTLGISRKTLYEKLKKWGTGREN